MESLFLINGNTVDSQDVYEKIKDERLTFHIVLSNDQEVIQSETKIYPLN